MLVVIHLRKSGSFPSEQKISEPGLNCYQRLVGHLYCGLILDRQRLARRLIFLIIVRAVLYKVKVLAGKVTLKWIIELQ